VRGVGKLIGKRLLATQGVSQLQSVRDRVLVCR
jgi:hypothetical protein